MSKKLVAYFSASGVTKKIASRLAEAAGADLFEIRPVIPYTSADLDWTDRHSRSSLERNNPDARPEIAEQLEHMDQYEEIFIGFPIWWYEAPAIIHTFLESYDFSGKTIIPFATSGGSGMGKTVEKLKPYCAKTAQWRNGKLLNYISDEELKAFAENR